MGSAFSRLRVTTIGVALGLVLLADGSVAAGVPEPGLEIVSLEPLHVRVIAAAMTNLEPMNFPFIHSDVDVDNYNIVLRENDYFFTVQFIDKVRIEDCENPNGIKLCFNYNGTPGLIEFAVTVSKDATKVFGLEPIDTSFYRPYE